MRKIIFTIIMILSAFITKAQDQDLPKYLIENNDTIGIVMSIEQAQSLDNSAELLNLFKQMSINCDMMDTIYIQIINSLEEKVALLEIQKRDLIKQGEEKDKVIDQLNQALGNCEKNKRLCDEQLEIKEEEIKILKKEIFRQKVKKIISVAGNVALAVVTTILIVKSH
jgi:hypothetical protein